MGYGNGGGTYHRNNTATNRDGTSAKAYFDNAMTAHVWAQYSQSFGRSGNGNLYFEGRTLFSYGSHYAAAYILPASDEPAAAGRVLLNADSYSISTTQHVGDAWGAARHMAPLYVPELTALAKLFESGLTVAAEPVKQSPGVAWPDGGTMWRDGADFPRKVNRAKLARHMAPRLKAHFSMPANCPALSDSWHIEKAAALQTVAAVFAAAGCDNPERRAGAAIDKAIKAAERIAAERAKAKTAKELATLKRAAELDPREIAERIKADAKRVAPSWRDDSDANQTIWAERGREIYRAIQAGKAAGRVQQVAKARAVYKALRATLPAFESAATRHNRRAHWQGDKEKIRAAVFALDNPTAEKFATVDSEYRGKGGPNRNGPDYRSDVLEQGASGCQYLRQALGATSGNGSGYAKAAARVVGVDPAALAESLSKLESRFMHAAAKAAAAGRRLTERRELAAIRAAKAAELDPAAPLDVKAAAFRKAADVAGRYAERPPYSWEPQGKMSAPYYNAPRAWVVAGFTPAAFRTMADHWERARTEALDAIQEQGAALALAAWREGRPLARELQTFAPRAMSDGSAFVRAVDVTRDAAGVITGGTLQTSQGADAPLTHAIKVFKFAKLCRAKGQADSAFEGWHANGRTLRAGHFTIDRVDADGGFKAGCHKFAWPEIERLARELGVFDLAPENTTESRAHA